MLFRSEDAPHDVSTSMATWAALLTNSTTLGDALASKSLTITGDAALVTRILSAFDLPGLRS